MLKVFLNGFKYELVAMNSNLNSYPKTSGVDFVDMFVGLLAKLMEYECFFVSLYLKSGCLEGRVDVLVGNRVGFDSHG